MCASKHITNREEATPHAGGNVCKAVPWRADFTEYAVLNSTKKKISPIFKSITNIMTRKVKKMR